MQETQQKWFHFLPCGGASCVAFNRMVVVEPVALLAHYSSKLASQKSAPNERANERSNQQAV